MITEKQYGEAQKRTLEYFEKAGIVITEKEKGNIFYTNIFTIVSRNPDFIK